MTSATIPHASRQVAGAGQLWLQAWDECRQAGDYGEVRGLVFGPFEEAAGEGDWEGGDRGLCWGGEVLLSVASGRAQAECLLGRMQRVGRRGGQQLPTRGWW